MLFEESTATKKILGWMNDSLSIILTHFSLFILNRGDLNGPKEIVRG